MRVLAAGACAGACAGLILYPLEMLETRMILKGSVSATRIVREEGFAGLFVGATPAVLGQGVNWMVYTWLYAQLLAAVSGFNGGRSVAGDLLAGCLCGCITCWIVNPFWVTKIRLTEQRLGQQLESKSADTQAKHRRDVSIGVIKLVADMYRNEGISVFYNGVFASMCGCVEGAVQFLLVEQSKLHVIDGLSVRGGAASMPLFLLIGSLARLTGVCICYPYQVVRSHMQTATPSNKSEVDGSENCNSIVYVVSNIWKSKGAAGLYAGLTAKLAREALYGGILHAIFEGMLTIL